MDLSKESPDSDSGQACPPVKRNEGQIWLISLASFHLLSSFQCVSFALVQIKPGTPMLVYDERSIRGTRRETAWIVPTTNLKARTIVFSVAYDPDEDNHEVSCRPSDRVLSAAVPSHS